MGKKGEIVKQLKMQMLWNSQKFKMCNKKTYKCGIKVENIKWTKMMKIQMSKKGGKC